MFGFLMTQAARARRDAGNWLEVADKVYHYRRDELKDADLQLLRARRDDLRQRVKRRADAAEIKIGVEALEEVLRKVGGRVYPKGALADNIEFFLAAAIIILGIRAFFIQPFKIPTNSMWPSFYGMKHAVYLDAAQVPGPAAAAFRFLAFGATRRTAVAPVSGELRIPWRYESGGAGIPFSLVPGRKWLVVPTKVREYILYVDNQPVRVRVPAEFDFETLVSEGLFGGRPGSSEALREAARQANPRDEMQVPIRVGPRSGTVRCVLVGTGHRVQRGEPALTFDVLTGDQLFVDRFSYHFFPPKVGEGFVFRTGNIPGIGDDQYYIKRLVGVPGDTLEIRGSVLLRNGRPIEGAESFGLNAQQVGLYRGYAALGTLSPGSTVTVKPGEFIALGDNSYNSGDSRFWGSVPGKDAMGRPLFIYYPFTERWGPTR